MKKLKEVYRLKFELGYAHRAIASSVNLSASTVGEYLRLFKATGFNWDDVKALADDELEQKIYCHVHSSNPSARPRPKWEQIHLELKRKGVTLLLLWREYKEQHLDGLGYTRFSVEYRKFKNTLNPTMRFIHKAGEKAFVDYAGLTMEWIDEATGEIHNAQIFVGCLGCSHLIFAEATASQTIPDWINSHVHMLEFFGGSPKCIVNDNLKAGVTRAHRYDPDLNPTYAQFAEHYDIAIMPTRSRAPRDKSKVENAVLIVEREVIAPLRHQTFTSLTEMNVAIAHQLKKINERKLQRIELSRIEQFNQLEKSSLKPLPQNRFQLKEWRHAKVHVDYHVCIERNFYSVPHSLIGKQVEVGMTQRQIEIFYQAKRVAIHNRSYKRSHFATLKEHMPISHQRYSETQDISLHKIYAWSRVIGGGCEEFILKMVQCRAYPQQAIRAALGMQRLASVYGSHRFEQACLKALSLNRYRYQTVEEILRNNLDKEIITSPTKLSTSNIRGANYYQ